MQRLHSIWLLALVTTLLLASLGPSSAYAPFLHRDNVATSCFDHPSKPVGPHGVPAVDTQTAIAVTLNSKPVSGLCPGETYRIRVAFGGDKPRSVLTTVSQGTIVESNLPRCSNAITTEDDQLVRSLEASWQISCGMMGRVEVKVTSGVDRTGRLLKAQLGLPVLRISQCPANSCTPTPAAAPAAAPVNDDFGSSRSAKSSASAESPAAEVAESAPSTVASGIAAAAPNTLTLVGGAGCAAPSRLGYQCSQELERGIRLHYSLGGPQPSNACTRQSNFDGSLAGPASGVMHFAIESEMEGYVGLGFPGRPGRMVPADAVIGSVDDTTGATKVAAYQLKSNSPAGVQPSSSEWSTGVGVVKQFNFTANSHTTTVCFSRPAATQAAAASSNINPAVVPLIWAAHSSPDLTTHKRQGSITINMISGRTSSMTSASSSSAAVIAHGVLMAAAFFLLMPVAVLVSRHKWLWGDETSGELSKGWFHLHTLLQSIASAAVISSFILAMVMFCTKHDIGELLHKLYTPHFAVGVAVVALSVVQIVVAAVQPPLNHDRRASWRRGHGLLGWITWLMGTANCFLGVILMHEFKSVGSLVVWLVPPCTVLGLLLLAAMIMEVPRNTLIAQGRYDPATHTYQLQGLSAAAAEDGKSVDQSDLAAERDDHDDDQMADQSA